MKPRFLDLPAFCQLLGVDLKRLLDLRRLPRFFGELARFIEQGGSVHGLYPVLSDYDDSAGVAKGHYFHQDLLVSQFVYEVNPPDHLDIGSRIDGFVAHVASFRQLDVVDIRPVVMLSHPNIRFVQADALHLSTSLRSVYSSVSCLHAIEHFGLGRYGDTIDASAHVKAFRSIASILKPGGYLYMSAPVGHPRVLFNAHRIFDPKDIVGLGSEEGLVLRRFDYVDDVGDLHKKALVEEALALSYGCGIFSFAKPPVFLGGRGPEAL